jgi:hypothetical protein
MEELQSKIESIKQKLNFPVSFMSLFTFLLLVLLVRGGLSLRAEEMDPHQHLTPQCINYDSFIICLHLVKHKNGTSKLAEKLLRDLRFSQG